MWRGEDVKKQESDAVTKWDGGRGLLASSLPDSPSLLGEEGVDRGAGDPVGGPDFLAFEVARFDGGDDIGFGDAEDLRRLGGAEQIERGGGRGGTG